MKVRVGIALGQWPNKDIHPAAIVDLDGDGDLDIVTNEFNAGPMVLVSNLAEKRTVRYLNVQLIGKASNRSGLGAVVRVSALVYEASAVGRNVTDTPHFEDLADWGTHAL